MTHSAEALQRALDAAARMHAVQDMGRGRVSGFDRTAARRIVRAFVEALPDRGEGLGVPPHGVAVTPADVAHFLGVFDVLEGFEARHRALRGHGAFPADAPMPDPAVARVVGWLRTLAVPEAGEGA